MYEVEMRPSSGRQIFALQSSSSYQSSKSNHLALIGLLLVGSSSLGLSGCGGVVFAPASSGTSAANAVNLAATPTAVDFGTVTIGKSANQKVTVTNLGSDAVQIAQLSVSSTAFRVDGDGKLPVSLAAGSSLSLNVHFTPNDSTDVAGQLSVLVGTATTAAATVRLHGKGAGAAAQAAEISGLSCESLKMTGPGTDACSIATSSAAPSGGLQVDLKSSVAAINVPASVTVPAGEASVKFSAKVSSVNKDQTGTITATQGGNEKSVSISLAPPVMAGATPVLDAFSCAFTSFTGAGKTTCTVSLNGATSKALSVALGSNSSAVSVPSVTTVNAGSASASFTASVAAVGKAQTVTILATADGSSKSVGLQLKASKASVPSLGLSTSSLAFGNVSLGTSVSKSITLTSNGTAPVTIKSDSITGTGFSRSGGRFPSTLQPGEQMVVTVQFDPVAAGSAGGQLVISSNAAAASVNLSGTGTSASPTAQLSVNATKISFGPVLLNLPTTQLVTLSSVGKAAVTVKSVSVSGKGFSLSLVNLPAVLDPGQTLLLTLIFKPAATGSQTGDLTITSDSAVNPTITIPLSGAGDPHQVNLSWNAPVDSADPVPNYKVYRADGGTGAFKKLAVTGQTNYTDTSVESGQSYEYYVTSVNSAGAESVPSNTTTVTVP